MAERIFNKNSYKLGGNRSKFTYSCWIKRNKLSDWMRLLSIMDGSAGANHSTN